MIAQERITRENALLEAALRYCDLGWSVFPLKPRDKKPLIDSWEACQRARASKDRIRAFWEKNPSANIAVVTGAISGIVVLDVDGPEGENSIKGKHLPPTPVAVTGKGKHYYFKHPGFPIRNFAGNLPGVDLRGDGGYVVAPPSVHPSGRRYAWADGLSPDDVELAPLPEWVIELAEKQEKGRVTPEEWTVDIPEGRRNEELTRRAGSLLTKMPPGEVLTMMLAWNKEHCKPPLPEKEVKAIVKSIAEREASKEKKPVGGFTEEDAGDDRKETQAEILIRIAQSAEVFHTPADECYAVIPVDGHKECWPIRSSVFRKWLRREYFRETGGKVPNNEAVQKAVDQIEAFATFDGPEREIYMRVAEAGGKIYLDLCNETWEVVEISESGWKVLSESPVRFRRADGMAPLPRPEGGGTLEDLRRFVNAPDDRTWILLVSWLLGCFHPRGPYPVLVLQGEHGSGKTTTLRVLRELVDPNFSATRTIPREERDLAIAAKNAWVVAFDNLSGLPTWLSDALCRLSTGGGLGTRKLYTDDEEALFYAKRPVVVNGIDEIVNRNDLLDRALIVNLPPIPKSKRKRDDVFWEEFEKARPRLLGALCDAVQVALANRNLVTLDELPRMADFAVWVAAAEPALPWQQGEFIREYGGMQAEAVSLALESDAVAQAVIALVENGPWVGTATELLRKIEADGLVPEKVERSRSWPKSPQTLSNRLNRAAPFLRQVGIEVERSRADRRGTKIIRLYRQNIVSSVSTVRSESFDQVDADKEDLTMFEASDASIVRSDDASNEHRQTQNSSTNAGSDDTDDADAKIRGLSATGTDGPSSDTRHVPFNTLDYRRDPKTGEWVLDPGWYDREIPRRGRDLP